LCCARPEIESMMHGQIHCRAAARMPAVDAAARPLSRSQRRAHTTELHHGRPLVLIWVLMWASVDIGYWLSCCCDPARACCSGVS